MHNLKFIPGRYLKTLLRVTLLVVVLWTALLAASMIWNLRLHQQTLVDISEVMGRIAFEKDVQYRSWNNSHGGVYVEVTDTTLPNPYLKGIPDRIITGDNGKIYTLINPAYMTRQVSELQKETTGILAHITSLNPIRPANAADAWETRALQSFEKGASEVSSVENLKGQSYLRLMKPLPVDEQCLKCHAAQGYKVGEIRGGISESVPLLPLQNASLPQRNSLIFGHVFIWAIGLLGIIIGSKFLKRSLILQQKAEEDLVHMSIYDSITGLHNRRYFEDAFHHIEKIKIKPITVLTGDLDNLKKINDSQGHSAGDLLLRAAAEVLKASFRSDDIIARMGGDEFAVILTNYEADQSEKAIGRVRTQENAWNQQHPEMYLSISIGAATTSTEINLTEALKLADDRMYADKAEHKADQQYV